MIYPLKENLKYGAMLVAALIPFALVEHFVPGGGMVAFWTMLITGAVYEYYDRG